MIGFNFEIGKQVLLDVHRTLAERQDQDGVQAIRTLSRLLLPWLFVVGWVTERGMWEKVDLGDVIGIPAGLITMAEMVMAGLSRREVLWRSVDHPLNYPEGAWRVPSLRFQPEGGIADTNEETLREDLFRLVKAPRDAASLPSADKDDSIRRRLDWLLRDQGIRVYMVIDLSGNTAVQATQKRHLDRIRSRYPAMAVISLDQGLLGEHQTLFDEIRPLLMEELP